MEFCGFSEVLDFGAFWIPVQICSILYYFGFNLNKSLKYYKAISFTLQQRLSDSMPFCWSHTCTGSQGEPLRSSGGIQLGNRGQCCLGRPQTLGILLFQVSFCTVFLLLMKYWNTCGHSSVMKNKIRTCCVKKKKSHLE